MFIFESGYRLEAIRTPEKELVLRLIHPNNLDLMAAIILPKKKTDEFFRWLAESLNKSTADIQDGTIEALDRNINRRKIKYGDRIKLQRLHDLLLSINKQNK